MASVASKLIEEVTAHAQSDSLEDAREICADGTYFPNNLNINQQMHLFKNNILIFMVSSRCSESEGSSSGRRLYVQLSYSIFTCQGYKNSSRWKSVRNLFSFFDPAVEQINFPLNWTRTTAGLLMIPTITWIIPARNSIIVSLLISKLYKPNKNNLKKRIRKYRNFIHLNLPIPYYPNKKNPYGYSYTSSKEQGP